MIDRLTRADNPLSLTVSTQELFESLHRFDQETVHATLNTSRYRLRYLSWGSADRPLVFVHGMCDVPRSFAMLMSSLSSEFRCIGYNLAEGKSDGANLGNYRHSDFAHDLIALLDHLNVDSTDLFASSFGTTIALTTASLYPRRIRSLILQGGFARRPLIRMERGLARLARFWSVDMKDLPLREQIMRKFEAEAFVTAPREVFEFLIQNSGQTPARAVAKRSLIIDRLDLRPLLPVIQQPVLMLGGDRDRVVPRIWEAELEAGLPNVRRIEYSPCGHYPQYTHPRFSAQEIRQFLFKLR